MGWATGSELLRSIIESVSEIVSDEDEAEKLYEHLIDHFESFDCDTIDECLGISTVFDRVYNEMYPSDDEEPDEFYYDE